MTPIYVQFPVTQPVYSVEEAEALIRARFVRPIFWGWLRGPDVREPWLHARMVVIRAGGMLVSPPVAVIVNRTPRPPEFGARFSDMRKGEP